MGMRLSFLPECGWKTTGYECSSRAACFSGTVGTFPIVSARPTIRQIYSAMISHNEIEFDKLRKYKIAFVFDS
jgi:hypothetical protein